MQIVVIHLPHPGADHPCAAGPLPTVSKGTHATVPLVDALTDQRWGAEIVEQSGSTLKLSVSSPASAVCGRYALTVTCGPLRGEAPTTHDGGENIVVLFNPWCEGELGTGRRHGSSGMQGGVGGGEERLIGGGKMALRNLIYY